jgi:ketosteroid isomerase-like protein
MKKFLLLMIALLVGMGVSVFGRAQQDDGFKQFYADFQSAVKAGDKEKVASMINFDDFTWESTEALRQVKTKEAFLKNYDKMFTPTIKAKIATGKLDSADGNYFTIWHTKSLEYSLYFAHQKDGSYTFLGLTMGPY